MGGVTSSALDNVGHVGKSHQRHAPHVFPVYYYQAVFVDGPYCFYKFARNTVVLFRADGRCFIN